MWKFYLYFFLHLSVTTNLVRLLWCSFSTFCLSNMSGKWFALNVDLFSTYDYTWSKSFSTLICLTATSPKYAKCSYWQSCGWWCRYASNLDNKRADLFQAPDESSRDDNSLLASCKHAVCLLLEWSFLSYYYHRLEKIKWEWQALLLLYLY